MFEFTTTFGYNDTITTTRDAHGRFFRATIHHDEDAQAPWENEDGHGPVSEWRASASKRPGERILMTDRGHAVFYDIQGATTQAKSEHWGCTLHTHATTGEEIACAVKQDYEHLRAWCHDEWWYVGVVLSLHQETEDGDILTLADHLASLWGIASTDSAYLTQVANDLLDEAHDHAAAHRFVTTLEASKGVTP